MESIRFSYIQNIWFLCVTIILTAGCSVSGVIVSTPPNLEMAMADCQKLKSHAESQVKLVKLAEQQGKLSSGELTTIQTTYTEAQNLFSQWIDNVQNDLINKRFEFDGSDTDYKALSQSAADKAKEFNELVDKTLQISTRGNEIETIKSFIKVGSEIIDTVKNIDQSKRQELTQQLEKLRWKNYGMIS